MKKVLLRAPTLTNSGYGVHARQIAKWLFKKQDELGTFVTHTELLRWGNTPWITDVEKENHLIGRIFQASSYREEKYDVTLQLQLPNEWNTSLGQFNIGITAGVESNIVPRHWIDCVKQMNLVIVPSEYSKRAFVNTDSSVADLIHVVPECFIDEIMDETAENGLGLNLDTTFNFLLFGQFTGNIAETDRKNLAYTIKWLCEEFSTEKDVGIILKTNMGRNTIFDKNMCEKLLQSLLSQVKISEFPKIHLLHGEMDNSDVAKLYKDKSIKALVSMTHGEGFGLPILEAAASGLPVIVSDYSAQTEYLKLGKYIGITTKELPVPKEKIDGQIFTEGAMWGYPSEEEFKSKVRKFYKAPSIPKTWASDLKIKIQEKYKFEKIAKHYDNILSELLT